MTSFSSIPIRFIVEGVGEAKGEFIRFLAPRTVNALVRILPFEGRAALLNGGIYFPVSINLGVEKAKRSVDSGLIAYWPMARSLCIFYKATKTHTPVNPVGKVRDEDLNVFRQVKIGAKITVVKI